MSNIIIPLRFSPLLLTWLALLHAGAVLCLTPIAMPLSLHVALIGLIAGSFFYHYLRQKRLQVFQHLEWHADTQRWLLTDVTRQHECVVSLKPGSWLMEHFLLLPFSAKALSGKVSLLFAFDRYSINELKQLRIAVLQHQYFLKQNPFSS